MTDGERAFHTVLAYVLGFIAVAVMITDGFGFWFVLVLTACAANILVPFEYARRKK